ncbi:Conserved hypothetical protein [Candidatus Phytoplasma australiense]|uniref:DUF2963 domain-containing protein n=1 Tax=Phytoplasma australiense TaxID=59748 RepID=B1V9L8_PHYAS|nr:Conserved hypothetical protein [Candidatus Phytoplasma australiense]
MAHQTAIKDGFIFWDANKHPQEIKCNTHLISIKLPEGRSKTEAIKNYLTAHNITKNPVYIKLGCYNAFPNDDAFLNFPLGDYKPDSKTITEYNPKSKGSTNSTQTIKETTQTIYYDNSQTIKEIIQYTPDIHIGKRTKHVLYHPDGSLDFVTIYNSDGNRTKEFQYRPDGTIKTQKTYYDSGKLCEISNYDTKDYTLFKRNGRIWDEYHLSTTQPDAPPQIPLPYNIEHTPSPHQKFNLEAIYFDDGIRFLPSESPEVERLKKDLTRLQYEVEVDEAQNNSRETINQKLKTIRELKQRIITSQKYTIEDLLKLSNGARNVYLFSFNTQKEEINITFPDSLDPQEAIKTWKQENSQTHHQGITQIIKIPKYTSITLGPPINKVIKHDANLTTIHHTFETTDKIYHITCTNTKQITKILEEYHNKYVSWLQQCYIKPGVRYTLGDIKHHFGYRPTDIYNEDGTKSNFTCSGSGWRAVWYVDEQPCNWWYNIFSHFYTTQSPPPKPTELMTE